MAKKKANTGFRNNSLFCFSCGDSYKINYPQPINMMTAIMKEFEKTHKSCEQTWKEPVNEVGKTEEENCMWWMAYGEHGLSSKTIFNTLKPDSIRKLENSFDCPPSDSDDFRRCHLLIEAIPQFRDKLDQLRVISEVWNNLVENWDKITEMLLEQIEKKKSNGLYEFMKTLGC